MIITFKDESLIFCPQIRYFGHAETPSFVLPLVPLASDGSNASDAFDSFDAFDASDGSNTADVCDGSGE